MRPVGAASPNLVWRPYLQQLSDTSVTILWTTRSGVLATLRYSTDTSYSTIASGTSRSLAALGTQEHRVVLTGLRPSTTYYYKIITDGEDLLPDELLSFRTAPRTGSTSPFTFLAFGDYGMNTNAQKALRNQMLRDTYDFIVTVGDNAYGEGSYSNFHDTVFTIYGSVFSRGAVFPTLGNREYLTDDGAPYLDLFDLPRQAWRAADAERYYSFDYGNVHFVALDSNTPLNTNDGLASDDMFDWLRDDLSRTTQRWTIVVLHHSSYSTGPHGSDARVRSALVPIFEEYGVEMVLSGHDHNYQRTKPLRNGQVTTVEQGGIVYIVSGAGASADDPCESAAWLEATYCSQSTGLYNRISVNGETLIVEAIDSAGAVKDRYKFGEITPPTSTPTNIATPTSTPLPTSTPRNGTGQMRPWAWLPLIYFEGGMTLHSKPLDNKNVNCYPHPCRGNPGTMAYAFLSTSPILTDKEATQ